jgi:hypothetical protein
MGPGDFSNIRKGPKLTDLIRGEQPDVEYREATRTNVYAFIEGATHHERRLNSDATFGCLVTGLWLMSGVEMTRGATTDITLNEQFCDNSLNERYHITGTPQFTATPMSTTPVFLTTEYVVSSPGSTPSTTLDGVNIDAILEGRVTLSPPVASPVKVLHVRIRVYAWDANGQPASNVRFTWTSVAEGVITRIA